jgi:rfaE bifunctional protein nucleotidyltransferase chain/domain
MNAAGPGEAGPACDARVKLLDLRELAETVRRARSDGKTVVHCHGVFDLLHPGHIRHFQQAARMGDLLVVTVTQDRFVNKGPGRPVFGQNIRAESIAAIGCVDYVAVNDRPDAVATIRLLRPDIYVKGDEFRDLRDGIGHIEKEAAAVEAVGGRIEFTHDLTFSSSRLLNRHFGVLPQAATAFLAGFRQRHTAEDITHLLRKFADLRILVLGEAIIDEYHFCRALGKPAKSASISARMLREEAYAGGSLAVANHLAGFCRNVQLVTCLGCQDTREEFIRASLKPAVTPRFFYRGDSSTVVKRRYIEPFVLTKMFEIGFFDDADLPPGTEGQLVDYLSSELDSHDLVLVADFGHGMITPRLTRVLCDKSPYLAVNTQTNSANMGFNVVTKYGRADYVCIDEREMRFAARDRTGRIEGLFPQIRGQMQCGTMTVTLGGEGSAVSRDGGYQTVPAFSDQIVDSLGAGDAFLAITSPCALLGADPEVIGFVGNAVGALAIQIVGNKESIEPTPLLRYVATLLK